MSRVLEIARLELAVLLRTRRAAAVALLYLLAALLTGGTYVQVLRGIESRAIAIMGGTNAPEDQIEERLAEAGRDAYPQALAWFAGVPEEELEPTLRDSPVLPFVMACSLTFLPLLILLTSFDALASDLSNHTLRYTLLRSSRYAILAGKLVAHGLLFSLLMLGSTVIVVAIAGVQLTSITLWGQLPGLTRMWSLLLAFGFCYVAIAGLCSSWAQKPFGALLSALALVVVLRLLGATSAIAPESRWAILSHLHWLSPAGYESGFWRAGLRAPAQSAGGYLALGAMFTILACLRLRYRDL